MKLLFALCVPVLAGAALLPETIGLYQRGAVSKPELADRGVWDEYGLKESETAVFESGKKKLTATVWRLQDPTGALGAYDWQRDPKSKPSSLAKIAVETPAGVLVLHGNYLVSIDGYKPATEELTPLLGGLNHVDTTSLPALPGYMPAEGRVPNSERYVLGPAALARFAPAIPPSTVAFHNGAEGQIGVFRGSKGDATMAIFNYPTHQIAMQQITEFVKIPGAVAQRSGPLVAVVLSPPDPDQAQHLLGQVRYQAEVTLDEYVPTLRDNPGNLLYNIFVLTGILLAFTVVAGIAFGGLKAFRRRGHRGDEADAMITLDLRQ